MLEVHRKNISIHGLLLILSLKTNSNDFCVCHNVRSHFCLVRTFPIKEPVQHESESLRQWILSIFMPSESQNCYTGSSLILPRLIITSLILLSLGVIRGHGLPHCVQSKGGKNAPYKYNVNLDSKRLGLPLRTFEDQIYINYSQKHDSNIDLEAYHVRKVERVIWCHNWQFFVENWQQKH